MLELDRIRVTFGPVTALDGVSLKLAPGQIGSVIGANGAGKSTLLKAVSGLVAPNWGSIKLMGHEKAERVPAHQRLGLGVAHVLEGHRVFGDQSVEANLLLGALVRYRRPAQRAEVFEDLREQYRRFPILEDRRKQRAATLSGGEQQMLATAAALMSRPKLLLLDEPSLGLAPKLVEETFDLVEKLRDGGLTILLVEQHAARALAIADYAWVLQHGRVTIEGPPSELRGHDAVGDAYLGATNEHA